MHRLIRGRQLVDDAWFYVGIDEGEAPAGAPRVLKLPEYLTARAAGEDGARLGVHLVPTDVDVSPLAPYVATLPLVMIEFPSVGDGRGFTQASLLRGRFKFRGELRSHGKGVRADLIFFMARCGFDSFDLAEGENVETAMAQLERFSVAYQDYPDGLVRPRHRYGS
jgi:uncharacterized protein (DUF934 family)